MRCRLALLLEENDRAHFMTKRFDRKVVKGVTQKHHLQTLCAMDRLDFRQRATHAYAQRARELLSDVRAALDNWTAFGKEAGLGPATVDRVAEDFCKL